MESPQKRRVRTRQQIWFMTLYDQDEASDLTPKETSGHLEILWKDSGAVFRTASEAISRKIHASISFLIARTFSMLCLLDLGAANRLYASLDICLLKNAADIWDLPAL